jgi:hypothetical protein
MTERFAALPMSQFGTYRRFAGVQQLCRFRGEADLRRVVRLGQSVENVEGFGCRLMATMRLAPGPASESLGRN